MSKLSTAPGAHGAATPTKLFIAALLFSWQLGLFAGETTPEQWAGVLEHEEKSAFSHIRIRKIGQLRSMMFVRDNGQEVFESRIDLDRPYAFQLEYPRFLMANFLIRPQPKSVLIVGLGGGAMIHFLQHIDPTLRIDVAEIDPVVVRLAEHFFYIRPNAGVTIITTDALKFINETRNKYDVIYLDAFLKPSADTDATGAPLNQRAIEFYKAVQSRLNPGGLMAINLNRHADDAKDLRTINTAFAQTYVFLLQHHYVALGSMDASRISHAEMEKRGRELDLRFNVPGISFHAVSQFLQR
jgi:spermidine synthase